MLFSSWTDRVIGLAEVCYIQLRFCSYRESSKWQGLERLTTRG